MNETKNPVGRPSELVNCLGRANEYLQDGYQSVGEVVPTAAGLACWLGVSRKTVYNYANQSEEFLHILEGVMSMQEVKLLASGLKGEFNPTIVKLMLTKHGYSDKQELVGSLQVNKAPLSELFEDEDT